MTRFIEGLDRQQTMSLPEHLDDYLDQNSPVGALDAFTALLDFATLGFHARPAAALLTAMQTVAAEPHGS